MTDAYKTLLNEILKILAYDSGITIEDDKILDYREKQLTFEKSMAKIKVPATDENRHEAYSKKTLKELEKQINFVIKHFLEITGYHFEVLFFSDKHNCSTCKNYAK